MSLNVLARPDTMAVDPETKDYPAISKALIFLTGYVGIDEITEENAWRFWVRVNAWERVVGPMIFGPDHDTPYSITIEDVREHIGLRTNAFPEISGPEFGAKLYGMLRDRIYSGVRRDYFDGDFHRAQKVLYPLEQHEQHGTLECGCPANVVTDEGHQEGCEHYESYDED